MSYHEMTLNELIMLLALDDEHGKVRWQTSPYLDYALGGAMLSELAARGLIRVDDSGIVHPEKERGETGSALLDEALARIANSSEPQTVPNWVAHLANIEKLAERHTQEMVEKGILEKEEDSFLLFFHRTRYPARDSTPEKRIITDIREAVLGDGPVEPRLGVLITLAHGAHLLKGHLTSEELESRSARLAQIARGDNIGEAACHLIKEAERALYVASSIPFMGVPQL